MARATRPINAPAESGRGVIIFLIFSLVLSDFSVILLFMKLTVTHSNTELIPVGEKVSLSNNETDLRILLPDSVSSVSVKNPSFSFDADDYDSVFDIRGYIETAREDLFEMIRITVK